MSTTLVKPRSARQAAVLYGWAAATCYGLRTINPGLVKFIADWSQIPVREVEDELAQLARDGFKEVPVSWAH